MSVAIYSRHLRILRLLNFTKGENLEFIQSFFKISKANLNLIIRDIHDSVPNISNSKKIDLIIKEILNHENVFEILKSNQIISKDERVFFLILKILIKGNLNLESLSKKLEVSRRTLNGDLVDIKKDLENFDLIIESHTGKGVFLTGDNINVKRALSCYIYKFLVEEPYLPQIFLDYFSYLFHDNEVDILLKKDIENFLSYCHMDNFFCNRELLKSFYISFKYLDDKGENDKNSLGNSLKDFSVFKFYFSKIFSNEDLEKFYEFFHDSLFKNIDFNEIPYFLNILRICTGNFPEESIYFYEHLEVWNEIIKKTFNKEISPKEAEILKKIILRVGVSSKQKHYLSIQELYFLNLHIDQETVEKCIALFTNFREHYWNISFNDVISIYFLLNSVKSEKKEIVILYRDIPKYMVENLKDKIEHQYNVTIKDFVNIHFFDTFKKNNSIKTLGVFTELPIDTEKYEILNLNLNI